MIKNRVEKNVAIGLARGAHSFIDNFWVDILWRLISKYAWVSYWAKIIDGKQSNLSNILYKLCLALSNIEGKNFIWLSSVKDILNECGLAYIWNTQTFQNTE
jgi:hypothetical protein